MTGSLLVPPAVLPTIDPLARAAVDRGMAVVSAVVPAVASAVPSGRVHYYGGPLFADRLVADLRPDFRPDLCLLEPADDWLPGLPLSLVGRRIHSTTLGEARSRPDRVFVKPPSSKSFTARVYEHGGELPADLPADTAVLVADVVEFAAEFRLFLLDGEVRTGSRYATWGRLDPAPLADCPDAARVCAFAANLPGLPSAVVVDVGLTGPPNDPRATLAVVEANMAWFSQVYMSDPARALDVVLRAAGPMVDVPLGDRPFLRRHRTRV
jgi:hypothetical protein